MFEGLIDSLNERNIGCEMLCLIIVSVASGSYDGKISTVLMSLAPN